MVSRRARLVNAIIGRMRPKAYVADWLAAGDNQGELSSLLKKRRRLDRHKAPRLRGMQSASVDIDGFALHYLRSPATAPRRLMLYIHGGAYIIGPSGGEWKGAAKLARAADCDLAVWDYPKAPEHNCEATLSTTTAVWDRLQAEYGADSIVIVGASAGGGLAASLMVNLRDAGRAQPGAAVLLSPWLDLTCSDPQAGDLESGDLILSIDGLRRDGALYSGSRDPKDPVLSALFSELDGLAPMQIHVGTSEIFLHDCTTFASRIEAAGGAVQLVIDPDGQHVGSLFPTPEGKRLRQQVVDFITATLSP